MVSPWLPAERIARARRRGGIPGRRPGLAVFVAALWLGLLWAAAIRPLNAPDEPAYLQTVAQVRRERALPEIHFDFSRTPTGEVVGAPGDAAVRAYAAAAGFADPIRQLAYQTVQPPLYFLVTALATQPAPPDPAILLYLSRLVSVVFGAGVVYYAWAATRELSPRAPLWAAGVAGVIALLPEACFNNARAGNDSLVNCLGMASFYVWLRGLRRPEYDRRMLRAGALVGLALLAKLTATALIPGLALVVIFRAFQGRAAAENWRALTARGLRLAAGALGALILVSGWWFARNMVAYGEPSGTAAANAFWRLNLPRLDWGNPAARWDFAQGNWRSFWGAFGWQNILMPQEYYDQALTVSLVLLGLSVLAGLALIVRWALGRAVVAPHVWQSVLVMAVVAAVLLYGFVQFSGTVALQAQGRYLYLLLLPAALLFTGGLRALAPGRVGKLIALSIPLLWLGVWNTVGVALVK
jgi:hypothetical protein